MKFEKFTPVEVVLQTMIPVDFPDGAEEGFRKVKETLQRMGVPSRRDKTLFQTAHILHKQGDYYICHFKQLFALDGKEAELSEGDLARLNLIVKYLKDWGMVEQTSVRSLEPMGSPRMLKVIKHTEKDEWDLQAKYSIGNKKKETA